MSTTAQAADALSIAPRRAVQVDSARQQAVETGAGQQAVEFSAAAAHRQILVDATAFRAILRLPFALGRKPVPVLLNHPARPPVCVAVDIAVSSASLGNLETTLMALPYFALDQANAILESIAGHDGVNSAKLGNAQEYLANQDMGHHTATIAMACRAVIERQH